MTSHLYLGYHHNWSGNPNFRRHWVLFLTDSRGSDEGTIYDVVDLDEGGTWERRKREKRNLNESGTYQDKVILGQVQNDKISDMENVIDEMPLPTNGERCQDWVTKVIEAMVEKAIINSRALSYMKMAPST